jgi:hypothetical protein
VIDGSSPHGLAKLDGDFDNQLSTLERLLAVVGAVSW